MATKWVTDVTKSISIVTKDMRTLGKVTAATGLFGKGGGVIGKAGVYGMLASMMWEPVENALESILPEGDVNWARIMAYIWPLTGPRFLIEKIMRNTRHPLISRVSTNRMFLCLIRRYRLWQHVVKSKSRLTMRHRECALSICRKQAIPL